MDLHSLGNAKVGMESSTMIDVAFQRTTLYSFHLIPKLQNSASFWVHSCSRRNCSFRSETCAVSQSFTSSVWALGYLAQSSLQSGHFVRRYAVICTYIMQQRVVAAWQHIVHAIARTLLVKLAFDKFQKLSTGFQLLASADAWKIVWDHMYDHGLFRFQSQSPWFLFCPREQQSWTDCNQSNTIIVVLTVHANLYQSLDPEDCRVKFFAGVRMKWKPGREVYLLGLGWLTCNRTSFDVSSIQRRTMTNC